MIPNQWYPIHQSKNLKPGKPLPLRRLAEDLVLWRRSDGQVACQLDRCAHKGAALSAGRVINNEIECPYHGFRYDMKGQCVAMPCMGEGARIPGGMTVKTFPIREALGLIWMWWGDDRAQLPDLPLIPEIADDDSVYAMKDWARPVHYTRYIESILEFHHVPFVHREGLFNLVDYVHLDLKNNRPSLDMWKAFVRAKKVDGLDVTVEGNTIRSTFHIVRDDYPERKGSRYDIVFHAPNLTYVILPDVRAVIWNTPIDDHNTLTIFRWYEYEPLRKVLRFRALRKVMPAVSNFVGKHIQDWEDVKVIMTQRPPISEPGVNRFTAADEMNAKYLSLRARLIREARESKGAIPDVINLVKSA